MAQGAMAPRLTFLRHIPVGQFEFIFWFLNFVLFSSDHKYLSLQVTSLQSQ